MSLATQIDEVLAFLGDGNELVVKLDRAFAAEGEARSKCVIAV